MKKREISRLVSSYLAPAFPDLVPIGDLLVRYDVDHILRGLCFDASDVDARGFTVYVFAQALFVPYDAVNLGVADDIASSYFAPADEAVVMERVVAAARERAVPFLREIVDASTFADAASPERFPLLDTVLAQEARFYCRAYAGDMAGARREHAGLRAKLARDPDAEFVAQLSARADQLVSALDKSHDAARDALDAWAAETRSALRLPA